MVGRMRADDCGAFAVCRLITPLALVEAHASTPPSGELREQFPRLKNTETRAHHNATHLSAASSVNLSPPPLPSFPRAPARRLPDHYLQEQPSLASSSIPETRLRRRLL